MPLAEQVVSFPLVGGVDENATPRLCSRLLVSENCRQFKGGSLGKRFGTTCVGTANTRLGGGTPPTPELLAAYRTELVRVGHGHVDTCRVVGSSDTIYKGRASEALIYRQTLTSGESYITDCDVAYGNGLTIYVCRSNAGILLSGTASIVYFVLDADGAIVVPRTVLDTGNSTTMATPHVVVIGSTAVFTWADAAVGILAQALDLTTLVLGSATTLVAGALKHSAAATSSTLAVVYEDGTGVHVGTWTSALSVATAAVLVSASTGTTAMAIQASSTALFYAYSIQVSTSPTIKAGALNPSTLATVVAVQTVASATVGTTFNLGIAVAADNVTGWFAWTIVDSNTATVRWASMSAPFGSLTTARYTRQAYLASKPFVVDGVLYALTFNPHSTHSTYFLVHLQDGTTPATTLGMRTVAVAAPRQAPRVVGVYATGTLSSAALVSSGRYAIGAIVSGAIVDSFVAALFDVRIGDTKPVACEIGGLLVMSGGVVTAYDGAHVAELGMAYEPDHDLMTALVAAGGDMTPGVYYYLATYEWRFANGAIVRSIPNYPFAYSTTTPDGSDVAMSDRGLLTVTAAGTNLSAEIVVPYLNLTNKQGFDATANAVSLVLYRTTSGGSTFYRASAIQIEADAFNDPSHAGVTLVDSLGDDELEQRPLLYVTGGALPSELPPSAAHVAVAQNRVWLSGTDDDTIWVSHEIVDGEAPTFSGSLTIAPFDGGRVVGVAALDEKKIILKGSSLHYIVGDGPAITGLSGSFSNPVRIPCDVGCTDARSIVSTPQGVFFLSQNGLALLGRDLSVSLVGSAVEDTVNGSVVAADVVPEQGLVRFTLAGGMRTVEFDTFHGGAWNTSTYADPLNPSATIAGATYCRGSWFYITNGGLVFKESTTSWLDTNGSTSSWVTMRARLRYLSLGDIQGFARVWYVSVVGERKSAHDLSVKLYVDDQASTTQTKTWLDTVVSTWQRYQAQIHVSQQECEGLSVEIFDGSPTGGAAVGTGQGATLFGVSAEVGLEKPLRRTPAAQTG